MAHVARIAEPRPPPGAYGGAVIGPLGGAPSGPPNAVADDEAVFSAAAAKLRDPGSIPPRELEELFSLATDMVKRTTTTSQLREWCPGTNIELYSTISNSGKRDLDAFLGPDGSLIFLYEYKPHYGHWCAVFKDMDRPGYPGGYVEVYDSLGYKPDALLDKMQYTWVRESGQYQSRLSAMLARELDAGVHVEYNNSRVQEREEDVATCGRHDVARLWNRDVPLDAWVRYLRSFPAPWTPDLVVAALVSDSPILARVAE